jgi:hypothetical protein
MSRNIFEPVAIALLALFATASISTSAISEPVPIAEPDATGQMVANYEKAMFAEQFAAALAAANKIQVQSDNKQGRAFST